MSPELRQIDPRTVTIGTNVRNLPELDDPEFVASVREWIAAFAKGSGPVKGAEVFIARALIAGEAGRGYSRAEAERLNKKLTDRSKPATALRAAIAVLLDQWNRDNQHKNGWREPGAQTIRFLTAMQGWGYELADVEREMLHPEQPAPKETSDTE